MSIPSGPLAYTSRQPPQPLSEVERLLLVALGAGVTGWNLGIPHSRGPEGRGCDYALRPAGRSYPSGAATYGSELLITDDSGSYITRLRDFVPTAIRQHREATGQSSSVEQALEQVRSHLVRLSDTRVELPREYPHIGTHNQWVANQPGSTLFVPVADQAETLLNLLWIYTGEGSPIVDVSQGRLLGSPERLLAAGRLHRERAVSLAEVESVAVKHTTAELSIAAYNIQLGLQALGLGGWMYTGVHAGSLLGARAADGVPGFGFRCAERQGSEEPLPLGIDGVFEPLVPPYVSDMREAVRRFVARKFGPGGNFDPERGGPFRDNAGVKGSIGSPGPEVIGYLSELAQDIYDSYGRFPGTVPAVSAAIYTQAQHLDLEFYDQFYAEGAYLPSHARHQACWHGDE